MCHSIAVFRKVLKLWWLVVGTLCLSVPLGVQFWWHHLGGFGEGVLSGNEVMLVLAFSSLFELCFPGEPK